MAFCPEQTKVRHLHRMRQDKILLQHALSRYVYNRSLFVIFTLFDLIVVLTFVGQYVSHKQNQERIKGKELINPSYRPYPQVKPSEDIFRYGIQFSLSRYVTTHISQAV